jgi:hypothetical protein
MTFLAFIVVLLAIIVFLLLFRAKPHTKSEEDDQPYSF